MKKLFLFALSIFSLLLASPDLIAETTDFGYCGEIKGYFGRGNAIETNYGQAIEIPSSTAATFKGCIISAVSVGFGTADKYEVEVFLSYNLAEKPFYSQKATVKPEQFTNVQLDSPYTITGETVYVGYRFISSSMNDNPMAFDYDATSQSSYGNWVSIALYSSMFYTNWEHYYPSYGNVCVRAIIEGETSDALTVKPEFIDMPSFVKPGSEFTAKLTLLNSSVSEVNDVEIEWTAGNEKGSVVYKFDKPIGAGAIGLAYVQMFANEENDDLPVSFTVTKVNGEPNAEPDASIERTIRCSSDIALRNFMVEKNTGIDCGYCPIAYYAFERFSEEITDGSFIPVAVHNYRYNDDPMHCESYYPWNNAFVGTGAPTATYNRYSGFDSQPNYDNLVEKYNYMHTLTNVEVYLNTTHAGNYAEVEAKAHFYEDLSDIDYGFGFVLVEDKVGPYRQRNYYSGGSYGPAGGFENEPSYVSLIFNDVAREIFDWDGAQGSLPSQVEKGKTYSYTKNLSLEKCTNPENVKVIAFVVDRKINEIMNSVSANLGTSVGINDAAAETGNVNVTCNGNILSVKGVFSKAYVYTLNGTLVDTIRPDGVRTVQPGLYLVTIEGGNASGTTFKVIAK